ncbi:oligosaccharide flippase family protein, partial [Candidatus Sumerlaeota bacterium]|nr:oligosaccharide flippase family protein [Candidatus Sumerlaeota bacterium]
MLNKLKETAFHGLIYGVGQTLSQAVGFILIPLYTRYLSTEEYGVWALLSVTTSVLVAIFGMGLLSALFRSYYLYDTEEERRVVVSTTFYTLLFSAAVLAIFGLVGGSFLSRVIFGKPDFAKYCMIICWTAGLILMEGIPFAVYRARLLSTRYIIFSIIFMIARITIIVYLVVVMKYGVWGIVLGNFLGSLISSTILTATISGSIIGVYSIIEAKRLLRFGLPLIIVGIGGIILNLSDRYFLRVFTTLDIVGIYNLGYQFGMIMLILFVQPFGLIWAPMLFSTAKEPYAKDYYSKMLTYVLLVGAFLWLGISMLSKDVIMIIAPPEYWSAYKVVPIVCFSYVLFALHEVLNVGIALAGRTEYNALATIIAAAFNLFLNTILIPAYGMMGAAYATILSFALLCTLRYFFARKFYVVYYEWGRILKILFVIMSLFLTSLLLPS